jgi:hypothetical protein
MRENQIKSYEIISIKIQIFVLISKQLVTIKRRVIRSNQIKARPNGYLRASSECVVSGASCFRSGYTRSTACSIWHTCKYCFPSSPPSLLYSDKPSFPSYITKKFHRFSDDFTQTYSVHTFTPSTYMSTTYIHNYITSCAGSLGRNALRVRRCLPWHAPQRSDDTTTESSPHFDHHSHPLPEMLGGDGQAKSQMGEERR